MRGTPRQTKEGDTWATSLENSLGCPGSSTWGSILQSFTGTKRKVLEAGTFLMNPGLHEPAHAPIGLISDYTCNRW